MDTTRPKLSPRFEFALMFAAQLHRTQIRKGSRAPYVGHLMGVASIALEHGADEDEAIAALLHDAIEDRGGDPMRRKIQKCFGKRVVEIVNGCTDADVKPKLRWKKRKEAYIAHIKDASSSVRLVSAADKLHNAQMILKDYRLLGDAVWKRFKGHKVGTLWYTPEVSDQSAMDRAGSMP